MNISLDVNKFIESYPELSLLMVILVVLIIVTPSIFALILWIRKITIKDVKLMGQVTKIEKDLAKITEDLSGIRKNSDENFYELKSNFNTLCDLIDSCEAVPLRSKHLRLPYIRRESPLEVTEEGLKALERSGYKRAIDGNMEIFIKDLNERSLETKYDIQNASFEVMRNAFYGDSERYNNVFQEVKDFLYENPEEDLSELHRAAGIYLRNKYLEK